MKLPSVRAIAQCAVSLAGLVFGLIGCSAGRDHGSTSGGAFDATPAGDGSTTSDDAEVTDIDGAAFDVGDPSETTPKLVGDPTTCDEAKRARTYVGCDYWPTVTANLVWSDFDFAVVVANAGASAANVTISRGGSIATTGSVAPNGASKLYLPWVAALKGGDPDNCGKTAVAASAESSGLVRSGAYHLVSDRPVTVYQFSALEYSSKSRSKDWSTCPGSAVCSSLGKAPGCFSFSNDASLLLPSSAWTPNSRVLGPPGDPLAGAQLAITAVEDATHINIQIGSLGSVMAGGEIPAVDSKGKLTLLLNAGDVAQLRSDPARSFGRGAAFAGDLSGSIVNADKPIQVISGHPCATVSNSFHDTCDHLESTVMPPESFGKDYFVPVTTGVSGAGNVHVVRLFGNVDGTTLTYDPPVPGAPTTLSAGQVVELDWVRSSFRVTGSAPFAVGTLMPSAGVAGGGDPSSSFFASTEQYRTKYVFLAPDDYDSSFADVVAPTPASLTLDGATVSGAGEAIGATGYSVHRLALHGGVGGAHVLLSDKPAGLQIIGYGAYTSYQVPGGLNVSLIAAPPVIR